MDKEKIENTIENIFELKYEILDQKITEKIRKNKYRLKQTYEKNIIDEVKEKILKKQIEQLIKEIEENNNVKNSIIMKEMYNKCLRLDRRFTTYIKNDIITLTSILSRETRNEKKNKVSDLIKYLKQLL